MQSPILIPNILVRPSVWLEIRPGTAVRGLTFDLPAEVRNTVPRLMEKRRLCVPVCRTQSAAAAPRRRHVPLETNQSVFYRSLTCHRKHVSVLLTAVGELKAICRLFLTAKLTEGALCLKIGGLNIHFRRPFPLPILSLSCFRIQLQLEAIRWTAVHSTHFQFRQESKRLQIRVEPSQTAPSRSLLFSVVRSFTSSSHGF